MIRANPNAHLRDRQRATVRHLATQELSNRQIAVRVGISESTVRRWRTDDAATDAATTHPAPSDDAPVTHPGAPDDAPDAHAARADAPHDAPFDLHVDDDLRAALAVLAAAGHAPRDAVRMAVILLADAYQSAWDYDITPRGTAPAVRVMVRHDG
jgi:hypothetical protein